MEKVSALENKMNSEIANLNEQIDGAFKFMDTRMDTQMNFLLGDKYHEIDRHFTETFTLIDTKINEGIEWKLSNASFESFPKMASALDVRFECQEKAVKETVRITTKNYLETKELELGESSPIIASMNGIIDERFASTHA